MKLSPPKVITWWIAVIVGAIGVLGQLLSISIIAPFAFWLVVIAFVLLALATAIQGL
jgi:hypothetical protein